MPCYGLAEATLAVTFDQEGKGVRTLPAPAGSRRRVRHGRGGERRPADPGHRVKIVAPDGRRLGEDAVGEVCINGPGVFAGYYRDDEATAESLDRRLVSHR